MNDKKVFMEPELHYVAYRNSVLAESVDGHNESDFTPWVKP